MRKVFSHILFISFACFPILLWSQGEPISIEINQDSTMVDDEKYTSNPKKEKLGFKSMFEGNPGRAALYSALLPGAGQIYNKKWLKAPIVWGMEGTAIGFIIYYKDLFYEFDLAYKGVLRSEITSYRGITSAAALEQYRDRFKKSRDYSYIALAVAHVLNIADAFVDRHLMEFDIDEDISLRIGPAQHGLGIALQF